MFADDAGETHFAAIVLVDDEDTGSGPSRSLLDVPTTTIAITEMLGARPTRDLHPPPRRQLVIVLQGAFEVTTSLGVTQRFETGDCLLVDDVEGKGHTFADVGDDPLITVQVGIAADWQIPEVIDAARVAQEEG